MATYSSILAWRIPWTEEPGGRESMESKESDTTEHIQHHQQGNRSLGEVTLVSEDTGMGSHYTPAPFWRCCCRGARSPCMLEAPEHKKGSFLLLGKESGLVDLGSEVE